MKISLRKTYNKGYQVYNQLELFLTNGLKLYNVADRLTGIFIFKWIPISPSTASQKIDRDFKHNQEIPLYLLIYMARLVVNPGCLVRSMAFIMS